MRRYRFLIVDDQRDIRRLLCAGLSTLPFKIEVVDVPSAEEALLVAHSAFDLMISDVRLPGISGLDLFHRIQKLQPKMKIMLMTGLSDPNTRQEIEGAGAEAFFYKPVDLNEFLAKVQHALSVALPDETEFKKNQPRTGLVKPLALVDSLENLRRKAVMGLAAVLDGGGKVMAQAGFLQGVFDQPGLQDGLARLQQVSVEISNRLNSVDPENIIYIAGKNQYLCALSINPAHLLVLVSEQPFQNRLVELDLWLPAAVRQLDQILVGEKPVPPVSPELASELQPAPGVISESGETGSNLQATLEEELAEVEISAADLAAVDALFDQSSVRKLKSQDLDEFWDSLAEESSAQQAGEGSISYDDARDMGLAPE
jgi:CheY-like chemotaxis protein